MLVEFRRQREREHKDRVRTERGSDFLQWKWVIIITMTAIWEREISYMTHVCQKPSFCNASRFSLRLRKSQFTRPLFHSLYDTVLNYARGGVGLRLTCSRSAYWSRMWIAIWLKASRRSTISSFHKRTRKAGGVHLRCCLLCLLH